jgi:hypothetical protein
MADLYPHKSGIGLMEPVALIGQNVCIIYGNVKNWRRVVYLEAIPPFQCLDIGAIAAQTVSGKTQCTNLELLDNEFGQFRWWPIDNAEFKLWLPQVDGRFTLKNIQVPVDMKIRDIDPCLHLTEFFVWEDYSPWFDATNFMDYALTQARIKAMGFRYVTTELGKDVVAKIEGGAEPCTYVVASGNAGVPR